VLAVADAYEAMVADRPYRAGLTQAAAEAELRESAGTQFDPEVVEALLRALHEAEGAPDARRSGQLGERSRAARAGRGTRTRRRRPG
jgi:HD-GYP domain-containing protein (c-di-GMP phosphodiesterase class II)